MLIVEVLAIYRDRLPADHWKIANAESVRGAILASQGRFDDAEPVLVGSLEQLKDSAARPPERAKALERVIDFYTAWGKPDEAGRYRAMQAEGR